MANGAMTIQVTASSASSGEPTSNGARSVGAAIWRGLTLKCPACGKRSLFSGYLKIADQCSNCGEELHHHRADDAPPYFTILIVGHIIVGGALVLEQAYAPPSWVHTAIWVPMALLLSLLLLPRIKGALVGLQWALRMHGFDKQAPDHPQQPPRGRESDTSSH